LTRVADELAAAELRTTDGKSVVAGSLWKDKPALLLWVRHFG
jgi:hypothetical protein